MGTCAAGQSDDSLRLVFVCEMWTTGFDVPSCSSIYLDKPVKNDTLMQTIARANRVFPETMVFATVMFSPRGWGFTQRLPSPRMAPWR